MTLHDTGLTTDCLNELQQVFANHPNVQMVKLYGSRAKGTFTERSDIDLVAFGDGLDRHQISRILMDLDDSNIPFLVDLQNYHGLKNARLIDHIDRIGRVVYTAEALSSK
jgi:predicted nucleotidyltransferase